MTVGWPLVMALLWHIQLIKTGQLELVKGLGPSACGTTYTGIAAYVPIITMYMLAALGLFWAAKIHIRIISKADYEVPVVLNGESIKLCTSVEMKSHAQDVVRSFYEKPQKYSGKLCKTNAKKIENKLPVFLSKSKKNNEFKLVLEGNLIVYFRSRPEDNLILKIGKQKI